MRIVVMGAGAIGGYYGGRLAQAGHEVAFVARGAHLQALQRDGLHVESPKGDFHLPTVHATDQPGGLDPADVVLFTPKAYDLEGAAEAIRPILHADSVVIPLLNGVDIAERLAAVVGAAPVLGGLCYISCAIVAPGRVRHAGTMERLLFGELDGTGSTRTEASREAFAAAGINAEVPADIRVEIWSKFLFIAGAAGMCALTRQPMGPVVSDPDTRAMLQECLAEIEALAAARHVALPDGTAARTLAFMEGLPAATKPSLLYALEQGNRLELDSLNGAVSRLGQEAGVPTPVNDFITAALKFHVDPAPAPA